ncbi:uncharacterized protein LOC122315419 [Carya illinoinensis]|uniref:DUF7870 domain-containing protein n=1 Tax=Carya illinoinensis TaxID=32201 RepID=A0A8T1Q3V0_CARIL|nr:uncharacterized protein LOC122315419 [Carya illinoinensis]KAG6648747.1 hypothetical protein CIPAW_07G167000 [Carya illinoinensis]KAG6705222.1 hypothetical protein I3842_07G169600 [Carya illinoinensis]
MDIDVIARGFCKKYNHFPGDGLGSYHDARYLVICRLSGSKILKLLLRSLVLALLIVSFPRLGSIVRGFLASSPVTPEAEVGADLTNLGHLPLIFRDLTNEGLLKVGEKAVFLSNGEEAKYRPLQVLRDHEMDVISITNLERQSSIQSETFDFAWTSNFPAAADFIDRTLKIGGIVAIKLGENPLVTLNGPSNYKLVYISRRFESTVVAMKKTGLAELNLATKRKLCGETSEAKKAALQNLEDVLLEPPRAASGKSSRYLKRTRYLPDLMGDNLESYPRRVFIDVGLPEKEGGSGTNWFAKHYPTRNKDFEMYKIETVTEGKEVPQIGMSEWLKKNVRDEEYVVMKSEAEVVEEMVKSKAIRLVDELFLECKPQGHTSRKNENKYRSRRAYWECLALYGRLRDEGVAVHQWWG